MVAAKKNKIQELIQQIEEVDKMIVFHANNPSKLMADQYEYRKKKILNELIEELMSIQDFSKYSFKLIYLAIHKYYPELMETTANKGEGSLKISKQLKEFKELEALVA